MNLTAQLLIVADRFGELTNRSRARVSTMVLQQGQRLDAYADGRFQPSVRNFEKAMAWFSANWPEQADWPNDIARPAAAPAEGVV